MKVHATPAPVTGAVYVEHAKALGPRRSIHPSWLAAGELDLVALRHLSRKLNTLLAKDMPFLQTKGPHCLIYGNCGIIAIMMTDALQRPKGEAIAQAPRIATIAPPLGRERTRKEIRLPKDVPSGGEAGRHRGALRGNSAKRPRHQRHPLWRPLSAGRPAARGADLPGVELGREIAIVGDLAGAGVRLKPPPLGGVQARQLCCASASYSTE